MNKVLKLTKTSNREILLLISAFLLLNLVRLGLFLLPFAKLLDLLKMLSNFWSKGKYQQVEVKQILHAVHTSNYYALRSSKCLAKALTTQTLMKICGYSSELKIGVAKENDSALQAHAWVEYRGKVIIGNLRNLDTFAPITSI
jgi:hypothetical protein